jgi:hypothetical protein
LGKILKFFNVDHDPGSFFTLDPEIEKIGSRTGINPSDQQHCLLGCYIERRKTERERGVKTTEKKHGLFHSNPLGANWQ